MGFTTPCWVWLRGLNRGGYPTETDGMAHRLYYERLIGPIPEGLQLDHLCRITSCVNPAHLEPVTCLENNHSSLAARGLIDACGKGHSLTPENVYVRPDGLGRGMCKTCRREADRRHSARRKENRRRVRVSMP